MKKRKLNSTNPKYKKLTAKDKEKVVKKLECTAANGVKVYSVWDKLEK